MLSIAQRTVKWRASSRSAELKKAFLLCIRTDPCSFLKIQAAPPIFLCLSQTTLLLHLSHPEGGCDHLFCFTGARDDNPLFLLCTCHKPKFSFFSGFLNQPVCFLCYSIKHNSISVFPQKPDYPWKHTYHFFGATDFSFCSSK